VPKVYIQAGRDVHTRPSSSLYVVPKVYIRAERDNDTCPSQPVCST